MTYTEIIAVKLFGWERMHCEWPDEIWYCHPSGSEHLLGSLPNEYIIVDGEEEWPDFEDLRLQWYWVRKMEDKLLEKELLEEYVNVLWKLAPDEYPWCENYQILSTAEQRVAACVKVLEGVQ